GVVVALDHGGGVHGVDAVGVGGFKLAQHALRLQAGDLEIEGALGSAAFGRRGVVTGGILVERGIGSAGLLPADLIGRGRLGELGEIPGDGLGLLIVLKREAAGGGLV